MLEFSDHEVGVKGVEVSGVKDPHYDLIHSEVVSVEHIETVLHHSESKTAAAVALVAQVIFIEVDLSKVQDGVVSSEAGQGDLKA